MKPVFELIATLRRLGVQIWAEGGKLRYKAAKGVLTPELLAEMKERKDEMLAFCQTETDSSSVVTLVGLPSPVRTAGASPTPAPAPVAVAPVAPVPVAPVPVVPVVVAPVPVAPVPVVPVPVAPVPVAPAPAPAPVPVAEAGRAELAARDRRIADLEQQLRSAKAAPAAPDERLALENKILREKAHEQQQALEELRAGGAAAASDEVKAENKVLREKVHEQQQALVELRARGPAPDAAAAKAESQALQQQVQELQQSNDGLRAAAAAADAAKAENRILREKVLEQQKAGEAMRAQLTAAGDIQQAKAENKVLREKVVELQTSLGQLQSRAAAAGDLELAKAENKVLREKIQDLQRATPASGAAAGAGDQLAQAETKVLREKVAQLQQAVEAARAGGGARGDEVIAAENKVLRQRLGEQQKALEEVKKAAAAADQKLLADNQALRQQLAAAAGGAKPGTEARALGERLDDLSKELREQKGQDTKATVRRSRTTVRGGAAPEVVESRKLEQAKAEMDALRVELENARAVVRSHVWAGRWGPNTRAELDALAEQNRKLQQQLAAMVQDHQRLIGELAAFKSQAEEVRGGLMAELRVNAVRPQFPAHLMRMVSNLLGDTPVCFAAETRQRLDTGGWVKRAPCYLVLSADDLYLMAAGRTDFIQKVPRARLQESFWSPVTRVVIFRPGVPSAPLSCVAMAQEDAERLLPLLQATRLVVEQDTVRPPPEAVVAAPTLTAAERPATETEPPAADS